MASEDIYMSTTETIPHQRNKIVTKSEVTWSFHAQSITSAYNFLEKWAREHDYDAVVGVRCIVRTKPDGEDEYAMYGTAIKWEY
jgi:uncharacterized protein YbjQ (UPF0145 family)